MNAENSAFTPEEALLWEGLAHARASLASQWAELAFRGYPLGAAGLARTGGNAFDNPVGERTHAVAGLFSALVTKPVPASEEEQSACHAVEELVRVRAVQPLPPGQALGIFSAMKALLRQEVMSIFKQAPGSSGSHGKASGASSIPPEILPALWELEARVETVCAVALDCYWTCRERLAQMKQEEQERRYSQIIRLANRKSGHESTGAGGTA